MHVVRFTLCWLAVGVAVSAMAACGGAGGEEPAPTAASATPTATPDPLLVSGRVGGGGALRSQDGRLEVRSSGRTILDVEVRAMTGPAAPTGWTLLSPVYEITARDNGRPVTKLAQPFDLAFRVPEGAATVLVLSDGRWEVVESQRTADGTLVATVDHLTPYAVARPSVTNATTPVPTEAAATTPTPRATATRPASKTPTIPPTVTPATTPAVAQTAAEAAKAAVEAAIAQYKNRKLVVTGASGYQGSGVVALPDVLDAEIEQAVTITGQLSYGLYSGVNEALSVTATATGTGGSFTLLIEPKTTFPANTSDAQTQLADYFPGATNIVYMPVAATSTAYIYTAFANASTYVMGFVLYEGVPIAFLSTGSGDYYDIALGARLAR